MANLESDTLTQLRTSDGAVLGTFPVGDGPGALAFDGLNLWVAHRNDDTVSQVSLTGAVLATFPTGRRPVNLAYDGTGLWVVDNLDDTMIKLRTSDGSVMAKVRVAKGPFAVLYDGSAIWVTSFFGRTVTKVRPDDGARLGTFAVGDGPSGLAADGRSIWVANSGSSTVTRLDRATGAVMATYAIRTGTVRRRLRRPQHLGRQFRRQFRLDYAAGAVSPGRSAQQDGALPVIPQAAHLLSRGPFVQGDRGTDHPGLCRAEGIRPRDGAEDYG